MGTTESPENHRLPDGTNTINVRIPNNINNPTSWTIEQRSGVDRAGGQVNGTGNIVFRIGLDSYNDCDITNPINVRNRTPEPVPGRLPGQESWGREPRWGQVIVVHSTGTHIIWIRQGEDTAELMRVGDAGNANTLRTTANAHRIRSFSPFNLTTAGEFNQQVAPRGGTFVDYPSQAGAFWQWGGNSVATQRIAWNSWIPGASPVPPGWVNTNIVGNWYTGAVGAAAPTGPNLATNHETCPPGFRRPQDGNNWGATSMANNTAALVQQSEIRQSLFLNPQTYLTFTRANSVRGFYADGFFDRRTPTNMTGTEVVRTVASTVDAGNTTVAKRGQLVFNPNSGATLFFPVAGLRTSDTTHGTGGRLAALDSWGLYATSTSGTDIFGRWMWVLMFEQGNGNMYMNSTWRADAVSIRCVVE